MRDVLVALALLIGTAPGIAEAAEPTPAATPASASASAPAPAPAAKPRGTRAKTAVSAPAGTMENGVLKFDPMTIEGRIEKPIPIHARERSTPVFQDLVPEESFLGGILDAAEEEPF